MNTTVMPDGSVAYWIYIVYALGALGLFVIGHRRWYGWTIIFCTHLAFAATGVVLGIQWLALGNATYCLIDLAMAWLWYRRGKVEKRAADSYVQLVKKQFAEGKKDAIYELLRLERDIEELTTGGNPYFAGRKKEDRLIDWLRDEASTLERERIPEDDK